jgi:DNA-directed RNA polymerase subunit E'/Rpb7
MFSIVKLDEEINIRANQLGPDLKKQITDTLCSTNEGRIISKINGYLIKILDVDTITVGLINDINGSTCYSVIYSAVMFIPRTKNQKDQLLDMDIKKCSEMGIWLALTALSKVDIIECVIPKNYLTDKGFSFNNNTWIKSEKILKIGTEVKVSIINTEVNFNNILMIGQLANS